MKKHHLISAIIFALGIIFPAVAWPQDGYRCGTDEATAKLIKEHPEILKMEDSLEAFTKNFVAHYKESGGLKQRSENIIIPVVFHIIHQGGGEDISDAQVLDEMRILNRDYNKQNADTSDVIPEFKNIVADIDVQFRLANIDPQGNCTNGIDRVYSDQTNQGDDYSKLNGWPRDKYLNVWVVKSISIGAAGYAYYPSAVAAIYSTPNMDGVLILQDYIGSIGTGSDLTSRALTHEVGHCFNLEHPWGNTNLPGVACGDDGVDDTPITKGWKFCPTPATAKICDTAIVENYQNYMDYSYCSRMFTEGQKARWLAALNSTIAQRTTLFSDSNLIATGTADASVTPCAPKADFIAAERYACIGTTVKFSDASYNGTVDSYYWEFPNGVPSSDTSRNPQVQFFTPGWQPVKLTVTNQYGSSTKSDGMRLFTAYSQALYTAPYFEGFEDPNIFSNNEWTSVNYDENRTSFKQVSFAAHSGSGSAQLDNYYSVANHDIDELVSPGIDLTQLSNSQMNLSFYYSLASFNTDFGQGLVDSFVVYASGNCGGTWSPIYKVSRSTAVNAGYIDGYYIPTSSPIFWKKVSIALTSVWKQPNVRFKFQVFSAVKGNNFYIDDINVGDATTGIEQLSMISDVSLFPNPTAAGATLVLQLEQAGQVSVDVYDITGKKVMNVFDGNADNGETQFAINSNSTLSPGIYIVAIKAGESVIQRKLVVQ